MLAFDHVIVAVESLEAAADRLQAATGLEARPGGRHPGHGTGNAIVPLGASYIELMTVVDEEEAASSPLGRGVMSALHRNAVFSLCLRADDITAVVDRLGLEVLPMSRLNPDGEELGWRLAGIDKSLTDGLPFFIQWDTDAHPSAGGRRDAEISWVEVGADPADLADWLDDPSLDVRAVPGRPGPQRLGLRVAGRDVVLESL